MSDYADPGTREAAHALAGEASRAASAAVARVARRLGTEMAAAPGVAAQPRVPGGAFRSSRQLEFAARGEVRVHVRRAREAGQLWHAVGSLVGLGAFANEGGVTVAEPAFDYAAGPRIFNGWFDAPVFPWNCPTAARRSATADPPADFAKTEAGYGDGCRRLAAAVTEWQAARETGVRFTDLQRRTMR